MGPSGEGTASKRDRRHPDRPYRAAARCGLGNVRSPAPASRQGSFHATMGGAEGRTMSAADSSTWVAFLEGGEGKDAHLLDRALKDRQVVMAPVVLTELLSDPKLPSGVAELLSQVPLIEVEPGYWQRAGALRVKVLARRPT